MSRVCPKPCGRLATAAVFIAVGVIQLLVGVILLRSEYADLLSGPDFMTAATNILVGCLYGIAASVWKSNRKRITAKRTARKNVLAALLLSVITVNTTAAIVLIMSEGNKLLTLEYFEGNSLHSSAAFAKEVLASAYVASVCSPIVCLVIALVALSGNCFRMNQTENTYDSDNNMKKVENAFGWVYERKPNSVTKLVSDLAETTSSNPESSSSETSVFSSAEESTSVKRKPFSSVKNIPSPLDTWRKKRMAVLKDGRQSHKRFLFDGYLNNPDLLNPSHERLIPRIKESSIIKKPFMKSAEDMLQSEKNGRWPVGNTVLNSDIRRLRLNDRDIKKVRTESYTNAILEGNKLDPEERFGRKCASMVNRSVNIREGESMKQKKYFGGESPGNFDSLRSSVDGRIKRDFTNRYKDSLERLNIYQQESRVEDPEISRLRQMTLKELKKRVQKSMTGEKVDVVQLPHNKSLDIENNEEAMRNLEISSHRNPYKIAAENSHMKENLSPDVVFEPRLNLNEVEAGMTTSFKQLTSEESPVFLPSTSSSSLLNSKSLDLRASKKARTVSDPSRRVLRPKIFNLSSSEMESKQQTQTSGDDAPSNDKKKKSKIVETHPKVASLKLQNKKREVVKKIASMASIAEVPTEEGTDGMCLNRSLPAVFSKRTMSLDGDTRDFDENYNVMVHSPSRRLLSESTVFAKSSGFSPKSILKKMWSSAGSEAKLNISDLLVDEDSLIGLSEDELIARTLRMRSLRKAVEERLKNEERSSR